MNIFRCGQGNGYLPSVGSLSAREAIATYSSRVGYPKVTEGDVIICSGCSGAVEMALSAIIDTGDNILIPR
jgi:tyrosine aminotransferase